MLTWLSEEQIDTKSMLLLINIPNFYDLRLNYGLSWTINKTVLTLFPKPIIFNQIRE